MFDVTASRLWKRWGWRHQLLLSRMSLEPRDVPPTRNIYPLHILITFPLCSQFFLMASAATTYVTYDLSLTSPWYALCVFAEYSGHMFMFRLLLGIYSLTYCLASVIIVVGLGSDGRRRMGTEWDGVGRCAIVPVKCGPFTIHGRSKDEWRAW